MGLGNIYSLDLYASLSVFWSLIFSAHSWPGIAFAECQVNLTHGLKEKTLSEEVSSLEKSLDPCPVLRDRILCYAQGAPTTQLETPSKKFHSSSKYLDYLQKIKFREDKITK